MRAGAAGPGSQSSRPEDTAAGQVRGPHLGSGKWGCVEDFAGTSSEERWEGPRPGQANSGPGNRDRKRCVPGSSRPFHVVPAPVCHSYQALLVALLVAPPGPAVASSH